MDGQLEILIDIRAKLDELTKAQKDVRGIADDTRKAGEEANKLGSAFKFGIGIDLARRGIGLLTNSLRESVAEAFRLADATLAAADNLQVDVRAYQVLADVVNDARGDINALAGALNTQRQSMVAARDVTSGASSALRILGLDYGHIQSLRPERQFEAIAKAIKGATDQEAAFAAASALLGERNVRNLRKALDDLATEGFDKVQKSAEGAGKFMSVQAIAQLSALKKSLGDNWDKFVAKVGNDIAEISTLFVGQAPVPQPEQKTGDQLRAAANLLTQQKALLDAQQRMAAAGRTFSIIDGDPKLTDDKKQAILLTTLLDQRDALNEILALRGKNAEWLQSEIDGLERAASGMRLNAVFGGTAADQLALINSRLERLRGIQRAGTMPLAIENNETDVKRNDEVAQLRAKIAELQNEIDRLLGLGTRTAYEGVQKRYEKFLGGGNPNVAESRDPRLTAKEGLTAGAAEWVMNLGTAGEQVAASMQSTLGGVVSSISQGIYGWITGTQSFGDVLRNLGATVLQTLLQTIIQMGVQWLVTAALGRTAIISIAATGSAARKAETGDVIANEAAKKPAIMSNAAGSSVSSWGLAAVLGIAALIAVMAAFGGFRSGGYTGDGDASEIAGVAHRKEVVFDESDVARWGGPAALDQMRIAGPVAMRPTSSTSVLPHAASAFADAVGGRQREQRVHVYMDRSVWLDAVRNDLSGIAEEVYERNSRA